MITEPFSIPAADLRKLVGAASPESALVYLYLLGGGDLAQASFTLRLPQMQVDVALASLRQIGLYADHRPSFMRNEPPRYCEADLSKEMNKNSEFPHLVGEVQRRFGRVLSTEELKILLSMVDYLGLMPEVVGILITYCMQKNSNRGNRRPPSFRTIEKEAYHWADQGIDTLEDAIGYVQRQNERQLQLANLQKILGIHDRKLTSGEEKYLTSWLELGFGQAEIQMAYEKTCMNIGSMKWPYCNSILKSWHEQGLLTVSIIQDKDTKPTGKSKVPMGSSGTGPMNDLDRKVIEDMKREMDKYTSK